MFKRTVLFLATLAVPAQAHDELQRAQRILNNVHHEMITCAAYFAAVSTCMSNVDAKDGETAYANASNRLISLATEIGQTLGLTPDAQQARAKMEADGIKATMNGNCMNISSVMVRHMDRCTLVASNPDAVLKEYEDKFPLGK